LPDSSEDNHGDSGTGTGYYLQELEEMGIPESQKAGRERIFLHPAFLKLCAEP
jgi:predicted transcriptional regulator